MSKGKTVDVRPDDGISRVVLWCGCLGMGCSKLEFMDYAYKDGDHDYAMEFTTQKGKHHDLCVDKTQLVGLRDALTKLIGPTKCECGAVPHAEAAYDSVEDKSMVHYVCDQCTGMWSEELPVL